MIKDLGSFLEEKIVKDDLSESSKSALKFFNAKCEEWRRLLDGLYEGSILDNNSITEERQLLLQNYASVCRSILTQLIKKPEYGKKIYETCGHQQKLRKVTPKLARK